jgi:hypothetical protein
MGLWLQFMKKIELIYVEYDGIVRQVKFRIVGSPEHVMFAFYTKGFLDTVEGDYIESGTYQYPPGKMLDVDFLIVFVTEISPIADNVPLMIIHEIENSSYVRCVGIIKEIISENSFICSLGKFGDVIVILESTKIEFTEKMRVEFVGELSFKPDRNLQLELYANGNIYL